MAYIRQWIEQVSMSIEPKRTDPEKTLRGVLDACADCDTCRFLMESGCLLFPELYRLYDKEQATGVPAGADELRKLAEKCTLCGLCPCPNIRADLIRGKSERVRQEGLPLAIRLLVDVQRFGQWGGLAPKLLNRVLSLAPIHRLVQKIAGIHADRKLPRLAGESFFAWARRTGLNRRVRGASKVAYFAGCTAGYLFPQVARAAVAVLQQNGVAVHVPDQRCCGMPTLLEGDEKTTLERVGFNLASLGQAVLNGYDLVVSCPTCGYLMKLLLSENACFSPIYQRSVNAGEDEILVPEKKAEQTGFVRLKKSIYGTILKDSGFFSGIDPLARIELSAAVQDMGEYLDRLRREKRLNTRFGTLNGRMVYYAPCHQREQSIGSPYLTLLNRIPGLSVQPIGGAMDCCGMGGNLGFKAGFHDASIALGTPLLQKIRAAEPEAVITDCLSCRLQFQQRLSQPVYHPLELLAQAYEAGGGVR